MLRRLSTRLAIRRGVTAGLLSTQSRVQSSIMSSVLVAAAVPMRFASHAGLSNASQAELSEEQQRSDRPEQPVPPAGWEVSHVPGTTKFRLIKTFEDEKLEIILSSVQEAKAPSGDSESSGSNTSSMGNIVLLVQKGSETMRFGLSIEDQELVLDTVGHFKDGAVPKGDSPQAEMVRKTLYPGPLIHELDSHFVDQFLNYLEVRGVDDNLAVFITEYAFWMEQQEYEGWLEAVANFTR